MNGNPATARKKSALWAGEGFTCMQLGLLHFRRVVAQREERLGAG